MQVSFLVEDVNLFINQTFKPPARFISTETSPVSSHCQILKVISRFLTTPGKLLFTYLVTMYFVLSRGRDGLDGPGFAPWWKQGFPDRLIGSPSLLYNGYRVSFSGVRRSARGAHHSQMSSVRVEQA